MSSIANKIDKSLDDLIKMKGKGKQQKTPTKKTPTKKTPPRSNAPQNANTKARVEKFVSNRKHIDTPRHPIQKKTTPKNVRGLSTNLAARLSSVGEGSKPGIAKKKVTPPASIVHRISTVGASGSVAARIGKPANPAAAAIIEAIKKSPSVQKKPAARAKTPASPAAATTPSKASSTPKKTPTRDTTNPSDLRISIVNDQAQLAPPVQSRPPAPASQNGQPLSLSSRFQKVREQVEEGGVAGDDPTKIRKL